MNFASATLNFGPTFVIDFYLVRINQVNVCKSNCVALLRLTCLMQSDPNDIMTRRNTTSTNCKNL